MFAPEHALLLIIDIQENLTRRMHNAGELTGNAARLIRSARLLDVPILVTEQAPEKIGKTVPEIAALCDHIQPIRKAAFSCVADEGFMRALKSHGRKQIIIAGIETHVCVYQTVCDLAAHDYQVQVAGDAVGSRKDSDRQCALNRITALGAGVTTAEMAICELLKTSEHPKFREVIHLIK